MGHDPRMDAAPSRTAIMAAVARGRHQLEDPPPWILEDPIALEFVGPSWRDIAVSGDSRHSAELARQIRASIAIRSRYAEDRLELGDFRQYVLLGAGLDSFRWRRPDLLGPLQLFEVDHPASQAWKIGRMDRLGLAPSEHQVFAPVDFEVESLDEGLDAAGFDWGLPTMFSWLGVIPYLTADAIDATLRTIARCRSGSGVVVEYGLTEPYLDDVGREFAAVFAPWPRAWASLCGRAGDGRHRRPRTWCGGAVSPWPIIPAARTSSTGIWLTGRTVCGRGAASRLVAATVP